MIIKTLTDQGNGVFVDYICDKCEKQIRLCGYSIDLKKLDHKKLEKFAHTWRVEMKELAVIEHVQDMILQLENLLIEIYRNTRTINVEDMMLKEGGIIINDKHFCKECWNSVEGDRYIQKAKNLLS